MNKTSNFFNRNLQFIYPIILIIVIPIFIIASTFWQIRSTQENTTYELQQKAILSENILANSLSSIIDEPALLQSVIDETKKANSEIYEITVLSQTSDGFMVIASTNNQLLGIKYTGADYLEAWTKEGPNSVLINDKTKSPPERQWSVTSSIKDPKLAKNIALLNVKISLTDIDALTKRDFNQHLILLAITVFLIILLLINFFHFFNYALTFKKLEESDKMKDDFISLSSHELKTPLAAIKGYLSMLYEGIAGQYDQKTKDHLDKVLENVVRLDTLVSQLLDVSRLEQGRMQFEPEPCDVSRLVEESIKINIDQAKAKKLKLEEVKPQVMPLIFVDPDRLRQVIDNLINNAVKYTLNGGVTVYYKIDRKDLSIIVKDTGIGMSEKDKKNLFYKYYRIKNEKTVDVTGTGLGLWISREIVKKMNGSISIESKENVGSEFILTFPIIKEK